MEFLDKLKFSSVCGIYCETECCIYKAYISANKSFRRQVAQIIFNDANRWPEIRCDGCKGEQSICWYAECPVKKCAYAQGFEFCIECERYPCHTLLIQQEKNEMLKKLASLCI